MLNKDAAKAASNRLQAAVEEHSKCLEEAIEHSERLYAVRKESSYGIVTDVETYVNSLANTPKEYDRTFAEYRVERTAFDGLVAKVDVQLCDIAIKGVGGAGAGIATGAATAFMGPTAAIAIATTFGTASTGAAITTLSGAAATNAALAWLGGGAIAAGGGGMVAGNALLALAGPVGWTLAGLAFAGGAVWVAHSNSKVADETNTIRLKVEAAIRSLKASTHSISELYNLTYQHVAGMEKILKELVKQKITDYREMSEKNKCLLIALVNHIQTLSSLLNKTIDIEPKT
ncbi:MAG: hypothetical protein LBP99_00015 [Azoarcus sp.]|jgi:hypothetical protein|nr:hypothetical protein [Azoarcus sp.]